MDENAIVDKAFRHKKWVLFYGLLILLVGVIAFAYVGEAIQFEQGGLEFGALKLTFKSGGTLLAFLLLSGWVFYLGSSMTLEIEHPDDKRNAVRIRVRRVEQKGKPTQSSISTS